MEPCEGDPDVPRLPLPLADPEMLPEPETELLWPLWPLWPEDEPEADVPGPPMLLELDCELRFPLVSLLVLPSVPDALVLLERLMSVVSVERELPVAPELSSEPLAEMELLLAAGELNVPLAEVEPPAPPTPELPGLPEVLMDVLLYWL